MKGDNVMNREAMMPLETAMKSYGLSWQDVKRSRVQVYEEVKGDLFREFNDPQLNGSLGGLFIKKGSFTSLTVRSGKVTPGPVTGKGKPTVVDLKKKKGPWKGYSPKKPGIEG